MIWLNIPEEFKQDKLNSCVFQQRNIIFNKKSYDLFYEEIKNNGIEKTYSNNPSSIYDNLNDLYYDIQYNIDDTIKKVELSYKNKDYRYYYGYSKKENTMIIYDFDESKINLYNENKLIFSMTSKNVMIFDKKINLFENLFYNIKNNWNELVNSCFDEYIDKQKKNKTFDEFSNLLKVEKEKVNNIIENLNLLSTPFIFVMKINEEIKLKNIMNTINNNIFSIEFLLEKKIKINDQLEKDIIKYPKFEQDLIIKHKESINENDSELENTIKTFNNNILILNHLIEQIKTFNNNILILNEIDFKEENFKINLNEMISNKFLNNIETLKDKNIELTDNNSINSILDNHFDLENSKTLDLNK